MKRKEMDINGIKIGGSNPVRIMGIINLSPESFYQGSIVTSEEQLRSRVETMEKEGADLIDLGGASTAPTKIYGTPETKEKDELERVISAMQIIGKASKLPISIDTTFSKVAEAALDLGAVLVNDVSGLRGDAGMAMTLADRNVPVVLMARCSDGCSSLEDSYQALKESINIAETAGLPLENIVVDPGIGFGKPPEVDFAILKKLNRFSLFRRPLLVGVSRKAFIGHLLEGTGPENRLAGTIAATSVAVANGADIIRAHDVPEACIAARIGEALREEPLQDGRVEVLQLLDENEIKQVLEYVGVGEAIRKGLAEKGAMMQILLEDVPVPAALIIKQEMLALGGDAAYHYDTIDHRIERTAVLLMGTKKQLRRMTRKMKTMRYFGLDEIGSQIQSTLRF
ncbi:MAG: dihydropteroate synthase [Candidatus Thorarchaeota archaeon]